MSPALALLLLLFQSPQAEPREQQQDLIHSDLPLWHTGSGDMWPRAFHNGDSFGCTSRIRFGDWRYDERETEGEPSWYRIHNYGVFHCFMLVKDADERSDLDGGEPDPSFWIALGTVSIDQVPVELWALQRGARPGSDYLLLSRRPASGAIESFDVLERECPRNRVRHGSGLSILLTRYCAINSREELVRLARRMSRRPPLGRLTFVASAESDD